MFRFKTAKSSLTIFNYFYLFSTIFQKNLWLFYLFFKKIFDYFTYFQLFFKIIPYLLLQKFHLNYHYRWKTLYLFLRSVSSYEGFEGFDSFEGNYSNCNVLFYLFIFNNLYFLFTIIIGFHIRTYIALGQETINELHTLIT